MAAKEEVKEEKEKEDTFSDELQNNKKDFTSSIDLKRKREIDEEDLEKQAIEKILSEVKRSKMRAERVGASGWYDAPRPRANKRFAKAVIKSAVLGNAMTSRRKK